jgi:hypothetical protein
MTENQTTPPFVTCDGHGGITAARTAEGVRVIIADLTSGRMVDAHLTADRARMFAALLVRYADEVTAS